jgi:PmbA protein
MKQESVKTARDIIARTSKMGAKESEVYIINSQALSIEVSNGEIETLKNAHTSGIGVRVLKDEGVGYSYTSDFNDTALDLTTNRAISNAGIVAKDPFLKLPLPKNNYPVLDIYDQQIGNSSLDEKISIAKGVEAAAKSADTRVKITESCMYQDSIYSITIVNSQGIEVSYQGAYCGAHAFLVAEENGDNQTGFEMQYGLKLSELNPLAIGQKAAKKAVRMLGAKEISTQKAAIVLDPYIATNFLGLLASSLSAEAVQKGRSLFASSLGEVIASPKVTIIDDGILDGGIASAPFDGEGVQSQKTVLINCGKLEGFLHNTYTAAKDNLQSTGNGIRGSFKSTPEVGATNLYLNKGSCSKEQLLKQVNKGLYITEVMGMHTANPISGDFSLGVAGIWIENGELKNPVRGVAIAGNIIELLTSIDCIADDLRFFVGMGAPTVKINEMTISGN